MKKLFILLFCTSCSADYKPIEYQNYGITYVKDERTHLCFAVVKDTDFILGLTSVNCDVVKKYLDTEIKEN